MISNRQKTLLLLPFSLALWGCLPAVSEPAGVTPLEGRWAFSGQVASGRGGSFQGTLTVHSTSASGFGGSLEVLETSAQGEQRRLTGPVGGRLAGPVTTEFEVPLGGLARRHIGAHRADTLQGSWYDLAPSGAVEASGTFRAVRSR